MIVCPLCEHAQAVAGECEVCGKRLAEVPGAAARVAPLEGLEPTGHAAPWSAEVAAAGVDDGMDGLEATSHAPVGEVAPPHLETEPTRVAPVDVDGTALEGLERTASELPGDGPTPLPVFLTCRYCRTPALPGERICGRCGMRLPVAAGARNDPAAEVGRVCGCGALVRGGSCPACGARPPDA